MFFKTCSHCGANLDPGERCDCLERERAQQIEYERNIKIEQNGQISFAWEVA